MFTFLKPCYFGSNFSIDPALLISLFAPADETPDLHAVYEGANSFEQVNPEYVPCHFACSLLPPSTPLTGSHLQLHCQVVGGTATGQCRNPIRAPKPPPTPHCRPRGTADTAGPRPRPIAHPAAVFRHGPRFAHSGGVQRQGDTGAAPARDGDGGGGRWGRSFAPRPNPATRSSDARDTQPHVRRRHPYCSSSFASFDILGLVVCRRPDPTANRYVFSYDDDDEDDDDDDYEALSPVTIDKGG